MSTTTIHILGTSEKFEIPGEAVTGRQVRDVAGISDEEELWLQAWSIDDDVLVEDRAYIGSPLCFYTKPKS